MHDRLIVEASNKLLNSRRLSVKIIMDVKNRSSNEEKTPDKKQKDTNLEQQQHYQTFTTLASNPFKPSSRVKGLKFGGQFGVKSFTVRRSSPYELSLLLNQHHNGDLPAPPFPSTIIFAPTNFTVLAHQAWHTLTLGLGTKKSKVIIFVFDTVSRKSTVNLTWPSEIPLGEVNKRLIRGLDGLEIGRFKFRKGCLTFYVFAVRKKGEKGFQCGGDLRIILQSVNELKDFLDHIAMLALPNQRSLNYSSSFHSRSIVR